jgi:hypothetical protein
VPLLNRAVSGKADRIDLASRLLPWAMQGGYLVDRYARLVTGQGAPRLGVHAAVFTRLYDDVLDETTDETTGARLGALFSAGEFRPATERECLLERIYRELERTAPRDVYDVSYRALEELHHRQLQSGRQVGGILTRRELWELTCAKGGLGMTVLGGLVQPDVAERDAALLYQLGSLLQLIDDYQDEGIDRLRGICTLATSGALTFRYLTRRLRRLDRQWCAAYGETSAKAFLDELTLWVYFVGLVRVVRGGRSTPGGIGTAGRALTRNVVVLRREVLR